LIRREVEATNLEVECGKPEAHILDRL
jgi:hypothetical protein